MGLSVFDQQKIFEVKHLHKLGISQKLGINPFRDGDFHSFSTCYFYYLAVDVKVVVEYYNSWKILHMHSLICQNVFIMISAQLN